MGKRLSKLVTRTGDKGTTGLGDGTRVDKSCVRIECIGSIDELNAYVGLLLSQELPENVGKFLIRLQHRLFDFGAELCMPEHHFIDDSHVLWLEQTLEDLNSSLQALDEFILPGGTTAASFAHICRTVCRRAERHVVALGHTETVSSACMKFINRLSDLFFVLARIANSHAGMDDVYWKKQST